MHNQETSEALEDVLEDVYALFRFQDDYESVSSVEHDLIRRIQYASAVVQSEKVMPPGGWDPYGR